MPSTYPSRALTHLDRQSYGTQDSGQAQDAQLTVGIQGTPGRPGHPEVRSTCFPGESRIIHRVGSRVGYLLAWWESVHNPEMTSVFLFWGVREERSQCDAES